MKKYTKILITAAVAAAIGSSVLAAGTTSGLRDIDNYWGKQAVEYFYDNHYVSGANGYFHPDDPITREGIASIINNMLNESPAVPKTSFKDIQGRWSQRAIDSLVDKQIMNGYSDNTFRPTQNITREEFAVIAYNYMSYKGITVQDTAVPYDDETAIAPWARKAVDTLAAAGYMKGANNTSSTASSPTARAARPNRIPWKHRYSKTSPTSTAPSRTLPKTASCTGRAINST